MQNKSSDNTTNESAPKAERPEQEPPKQDQAKLQGEPSKNDGLCAECGKPVANPKNRKFCCLRCNYEYKRKNFKKCSVPGCGKKHCARGYCSAHCQRLKSKRGLQADRAIGDKFGPNNPRWKGGTFVRDDGRVMVYDAERSVARGKTVYMLRYRKLLEEKLGRKLSSREPVHHKNEIPNDDRVGNIEITTFSNHSKLHDAKRPRNSKGQFA